VTAPATAAPTRFRERGSATADAAGRAEVRFNGPPRGERWDLEAAAIDSDAGTAELFRSSEAPGNLIAVAPATPNALDRDNPHPVYPGERLVAVFTGAGVGTTCTVRLEGRRVRLG